MRTIHTTMSFRAAWRFGCPHLAGQPVTLTWEGNCYRVDHASGIVARVFYPQSVREPGGVQREAETRLPCKAPKYVRRHIAPRRIKALPPMPVMSDGDVHGEGIPVVAALVRAALG